MVAILVFLVFICISVFIQTRVNPNKIPSIFGYKPFVVLSGSMEAEIFKGDLAVTREVDIDTLQENDIVAFRDADNHVVTHRIVDVVTENNEKKLITKGDNNNNDSDMVNVKDVEGKYLFKLSGFGNVVLAMQEPVTLVIVLVLIAVIGGGWMMLGNNKLSKEEREELEKLRKERSKSIEKNSK